MLRAVGEEGGVAAAMDILSTKQRKILERLLQLAGGDSYLLEMALLRAARLSDDGIPTVEHLVDAVVALKEEKRAGAAELAPR